MQHEQDKLALKDQVQLSSQRASSLEHELQQATFAIGVKQQEHERELDSLHQSEMQFMQNKLALNNQLQLSKQQASSLENELQQVTHVLGVKQQEHERKLDALHNQLELLHHQYEEV